MPPLMLVMTPIYGSVFKMYLASDEDECGSYRYFNNFRIYLKSNCLQINIAGTFSMLFAKVDRKKNSSILEKCI